MGKKSSHPFFSVCIPVYNAEKYLKQCIESVLNQIEKSFEIILVNDGSKDRSADICNEYSSKYDFIKVIHKDNEGPLIARHTAVQSSSGEYLLFIDSDDLYDKHLLEKLKNKIYQENADFIFFDYCYFSDNGKGNVYTEQFQSDNCFEGEKKQEFYEYFSINSSLNSMWRKCIHRGIYDINADYSVYSGMIHGEDKLASLYSVDQAKKIVYLKEPLYYYRINPASTTRNLTLRYYKDIQMLYHQLNIYLDKWELSVVAINQQKKRKLLSGYNCILSMAEREDKGSITKIELREAINYISEDNEYVSEYNEGNKFIPFHKKIFCKFIIDKNYIGITIYAKIISLVKKL